MKKVIAVVLISISIFPSCGPSRTEIETELRRRQVITDSINDAIEVKAEKRAGLKRQLINLKSQLAGEEAKLESIQMFKLLRTQDEKARQVMDQTRVIEEIKSQIEEVKTEIN